MTYLYGVRLLHFRVFGFQQLAFILGLRGLDLLCGRFLLRLENWSTRLSMRINVNYNQQGFYPHSDSSALEFGNAYPNTTTKEVL